MIAGVLRFRQSARLVIAALVFFTSHAALCDQGRVDLQIRQLANAGQRDAELRLLTKAIAETHLKKDLESPLFIGWLIEAGRLEIGKRNWKAARDHLDTASRALGPNPIERGSEYSQLHRHLTGNLLQLNALTRRFVDSIRLLEQLRASCKNEGDDLCFHVAGAQLGDMQCEVGDDVQAEETLHRALAYLVDQPLYQPIWENLVISYIRLSEIARRLYGDAAEAEGLSRKAVETALVTPLPQMGQAPDAAEQPRRRGFILAMAHTSLGDVYVESGRHDAGRREYEEALRTFESYSPALVQLFLVLIIQGDYEAAKRIDDRFAGDDDSVAGERCLLNTALGRHDEAIKACETQVKVARSVGGSDNELRALFGLANAYRRREDMIMYCRIIEDAKALAPRDKRLAVVLDLETADCELSRDHYEEAQKSLARAMRMAERFDGGHNPFLVRALALRAQVKRIRGDINGAVDDLVRADNLNEQRLNEAVLFAAPERQRIRYLSSYKTLSDIIIDTQIADGNTHERAGEVGLLSVLRRKGRILNAERDVIGRVWQQADEETQKLLKRLARIRAQIASVTEADEIRCPDSPDGSCSQSETQLKALETEAAEIRRLLADRTDWDWSGRQDITLQAVRAALPEGSALVELFKFRSLNLGKGRSERYGDEHYMAYVLKRDSLGWKVLDPAKEIDDEARAFNRELSEGKDAKARAGRLGNLVMEPIRELLGGSRFVLVSPDDELWRVPFAALLDTSGEPLVKEFTFTYLLTVHDLMRSQQVAPSRGGALFLGNPTSDPQFGIQPELQAAEWEVTRSQRTLGEGSVLLKERATELAVKQAKGPKILHFAVHGLFDTSQQRVSTGLDLLEAADAMYPGFSLPLDRSLLHSGLLLAPTPSEDGRLSALEVSSLDLHGTALVVLASCWSGKGNVIREEGLAGLRRAFTLAGSQSVLTSLWEAKDPYAADFTTAYYQRLRRGEGRGAALRHVQLDMLKSPSTANPYLWAGFTLSGDWRGVPLRPPTMWDDLVSRLTLQRKLMALRILGGLLLLAGGLVLFGVKRRRRRP